MTSSQVVKAHEDIGRQTDSMLEEIMASGQDVDTSGFQSAMEEFQKHMLSNATDTGSPLYSGTLHIDSLDSKLPT